MPITAVWDDDAQTVIRLDMQGTLTPDDMASAGQQLRNLITDPNRPLNMILVVHPRTVFPLTKPSHVNRAVSYIPKNPGVHVLVGAPMVMETIAMVFSAIFGSRMGIKVLNAKTLEEARTLMTQQLARSVDK